MTKPIKLLVTYRVNQYSKIMAGVFNKLLGQLEGFESSGFEVYSLFMSYSSQKLVKFVNGDFTTIHKWESIPTNDEKKLFWNNAYEAVGICKPSVIYTRYDKMYDEAYLVNFFASDQASPCIRCLELATYPYETEIYCYQQREIDSNNIRSLMRYVDHTFSTSMRTSILGHPNIHFDNQLSQKGLQNSSKSSAPLVAEDNIVRILSVANVSDWHGFDRIICGIDDFVNQKGKKNIRYHVVGEGDGVKKLKELVKIFGLQDYVFFEGQQSGEQLQQSYENTSVCVGCLGIHRKGLKVSSTLKVRESLANGLPVVFSSHDSLVENIPFALKISDNDDPVDIEKLIDFVRECDNHADTRSMIREFANNEINWTKLTDIVMQTALTSQKIFHHMVLK